MLSVDEGRKKRTRAFLQCARAAFLTSPILFLLDSLRTRALCEVGKGKRRNYLVRDRCQVRGRFIMRLMARNWRFERRRHPLRRLCEKQIESEIYCRAFYASRTAALF